MAFGGFGKNSGPSTPPGAQNPFANFPRAPSPSPPRPSPSNEPPLRWGEIRSSSFKDSGTQTYQRPPMILPLVASSNSRTGAPEKPAGVQHSRITNSLYSQSPDEIPKNSRSVIESPIDLPKSYVAPYRARSPPLVLQSNGYVGGKQFQNTEIHQRPFSSQVWSNQSNPSSHYTNRPAKEGISSVSQSGGTYQSGPMFQTKHADVPLPKRTRSPTLSPTSGFSPENAVFHSDGHKRSVIDYRDLDAPEEMPSPPLAFESSFSGRDSSHPFAGNQKLLPSSTMWVNQSKSSSNNTTRPVEEDMPSVLTKGGAYQSGRTPHTKNADSPLPKRTRSPTLPSSSEGFKQNSVSDSDGLRRTSDFQSHRQSSRSGQTNSDEVVTDKPVHFPAVKRTKIPVPSSSDQVFQENLDSAQEIEREIQAKAKRLARFKDELSQPVQSHSTMKNQRSPAKRQHQSALEKEKLSEDSTMDAMGDAVGANGFSDYEGRASSSSIVGLCPDMCPESERAERERKGDLDQYERLDGDRNLTSEFLAVKKYNRTAEREAELIRPMPVLQKTMDYLLNLLDEPYNDRFLGLYNFLWDRMRAIRMDLRMQHIFNLEAITMLEQMIRLHIIAMHELCEYTKGEGFSEGFDAHLNIEQMNKTSVELFQLYDDHRKKGITVPSEREFRGYYALLKLDKHPGYKVEPAELSLDLAKMTPEMRQTPEVLFARDVARACRTGNFIAFFRLAHKASYLQACLMHAHFSKLRTQALASLHSGLQINQGIPVTHVAKWLGMKEEDIGNLLEYYGFSVKDFEEPYMVKDNAFINVDNDFPVKRSKLVHRKRSSMIVNDVSFPSLTELSAAEEVKEFQTRKGSEPVSTPSQPVVPVGTFQFHDEEMHELGTILSPKGSMQKHMQKKSIDPMTPDEKMDVHDINVASASPLVLDFTNSAYNRQQIRVESPQKPKYDPGFRNSFGRSIKHDSEATAPITFETAEEQRYPVLPLDSIVHTPVPHSMFTEDLENEELTGFLEEDKSDEATESYYAREVAEAKLKLILRIWKRRAAKKRELREHKQLASNAAFSSLSLGPPIWQCEVQAGSYGTFDIDHVMSERNEIQERSWSVLNPSDVVAAKLAEKNSDAKCLCWKMMLWSQEEAIHGDSRELQTEASMSAAGSWLHSKLMPASNDGDRNLLVSSRGLAIWRSWIPGQSGADLTCCLTVIKSSTNEDLDKAMIGVSAVLFLLSEHIPLELQRKWLHDLVMLLPSGSCLPLLILSGSGKDESLPSTIAKGLGLHDIDESRVSTFYITFLKDKDTEELDGFFSDEHLREGLEWLASESPPQVVVSKTKTRELVLSHLNSMLDVRNEINTHRLGPNNCISAFNEALGRSMEEVAAAAHANPTGWPCPEIDLLEESSDEYRATTWDLPSVGWSAASRTEVLMSAMSDSKLPTLEDDLSWLSGGLNISDDIENQKSRLESCLINYLTEASQMMGITLAQKEASIMLQNCTRLQLHNMTYYIMPNWVSIFRRIFSWRLMNLTIGEVSSTYVLAQQHYSPAPSSEVLDNLEVEVTTFLPPYIVHPSFDELVEVGYHRGEFSPNHTEHEAFQPYSPMAPDDADVATSNGNVILMANQEQSFQDSILPSNDHWPAEENDDVGQLMHAAKATATKQADTLSKLLEKCNIMQNQIDKKLSIYF
ncbi:SAC3 family protein B isoform X2 [Sesamum indicum]|uniref:SAC3 family protein B isoform X2 n=1 Tax=Sesamum indicum TaxID=4182 RepID=A0A6I9U0F9_SESIN|nr:SAC3 family protein B isoform X2 [Sesamum indicum]